MPVVGETAGEGRFSEAARYVVGWIEALGGHPVALAIRRGLVLVLPLVLVGALALLLINLPVPAVHRFLDAVCGGCWRTVCANVMRGSFGIASLAVLVSVSISLARLHNLRHPGRHASPAMTAAVVLSCYFVLAAPTRVDAWDAFFSLDRGLVTALAVALAAAPLFLRFVGRGPFVATLFTAGHDPVVSNALAAAPAGVAVIVAFGLGRGVLDHLGLQCFHHAAQTWLAVPFQEAEGGLGAGLAYVLLSQVLWFFGLHGPNMLFSVEQGLLTPAALGNIDAVMLGAAPPYVLTKPFLDAFARIGGSGSTLCLIAAIMLRSRDSGSRKLALIALLPALVNVNEPMLFGIPLVLNPVYAIPFLLAPVLQTLTAYAATLAHLVPRTVADIHWTAPPLLGGFAATGSLAGSAMQAANLALGTALYLPFVTLADRIATRHLSRIMDTLHAAATKHMGGPSGRKLLDLPGEAGHLAKALANDLARTLEKGDQLALVYQPQCDVVSRGTAGVEALLRWRHPVYGHVSPPVAVALAEDTGLVGRLGLMVLAEACAQRARWKGRGAGDSLLAVNFSPRQFDDAGLAGKVEATLRAAGLSPADLEVEITESVALAPSARSMETLRRLRAMGVKVAIDDFGMGHTSLRYLREFPVDTVKIDRTLTQDAGSEVGDHIVQSIVGLCEALGIRTVVEGVETEAQLTRFRRLGCTVFQGYLISRPLTGEACLAFLREGGAAEEQEAAAS